FFFIPRHPPRPPPFPTRRSSDLQRPGARVLAAQGDLDRITLRLVPAAPDLHGHRETRCRADRPDDALDEPHVLEAARAAVVADRSEEHTSELQSRSDLVCRLLLE